MNEVVKNFFFAGDYFMPEMHLKQPRLIYSACGPFTKTNGRIQKFTTETGDTSYLYKNELDKACFQHDMALRALRDKAFNIAKSPKYDGQQRRLASMVYKFFQKRCAGNGVANNNIK